MKLFELVNRDVIFIDQFNQMVPLPRHHLYEPDENDFVDIDYRPQDAKISLRIQRVYQVENERRILVDNIHNSKEKLTDRLFLPKKLNPIFGRYQFLLSNKIRNKISWRSKFDSFD